MTNFDFAQIFGIHCADHTASFNLDREGHAALRYGFTS